MEVSFLIPVCNETAAISQPIEKVTGRLRIYEIPISYYGRSYDEGKKITWRDGFKALWVLMRIRVTR